MNNFADWLEKQRIADNKRSFSNGIRGYKLKSYKKFERAFSGIQHGVIFAAAHPNVGKTTWLVSMSLDLMSSNSDKDPTIAFYTFDDDKEEIKRKMLSCASHVDVNKVDTCMLSDDERIKRDKAYEVFIHQAKHSRFLIRDSEDIEDMKGLKEDIQSLFYLNKNLVVFIDGIAHVENPGTDERNKNDGKSKALKKWANKFRIPIILSGEVPKNTNHRPTMKDIKESGRYAYDARAVICISEVNDDHKDVDHEGNSCLPRLMFDVDKNKFGSAKPVFFGYLEGKFSKITMSDENMWGMVLQFDKKVKTR